MSWNTSYCLQRHDRAAYAHLPLARNLDGRPVWEPPIFTYTEWIDEEHDKKRTAILQHFNGNRARTTDFMDIETEREILRVYAQWLYENKDAAEDILDLEKTAWFRAFWKEVLEDSHEVQGDIREHDVWLDKLGDGQWVVKGPHYPSSEDETDYESYSNEEDIEDSRASTFYMDENLLELGEISIPNSQDSAESDRGLFEQSLPLAVEACVRPTEKATNFDEGIQTLSSDHHPEKISNQDFVSDSKNEIDSAPFDLFAIWL